MGIVFEAAKRVEVGDDVESERTRMIVGDVLVCITGAKTGSVGVCRTLPEPAYVNQHLCLIRPSERIRPEYLGFVLHSSVGQTQFALAQYGLKQGLSLEDVREVVVALPPSDEQSAICDQLALWTVESALLTGTARHAIDLLYERRASLISAAVTGQIDVRDFARSESA
ncbi:MAG: restriction endonuclease subunit S [Gemmatimonadetes bacterium]|nr:restriction endonuclease subunit S [Gemmatimonadota bacterium]